MTPGGSEPPLPHAASRGPLALPFFSSYRPWVAALASIVLVQALALQFDVSKSAAHREAERNAAGQHLGSLRDRIEANLNRRLHLLQGLAAFAKGIIKNT